jgi:ribosomal protein L40E
MIEDKDKKIQLSIWRGQSLAMAERELLALDKKLDLDKLFKRGKEIYDKAFEVGYFKWVKPTVKESLELPEDLPEEKPYKTPGYKKNLVIPDVEPVKDKTFKSLEHMDKFKVKNEFTKWTGNWKVCEKCEEKIPKPLTLHEYKKDGKVCGFVFDKTTEPMPEKRDNWKICRRCGESVVKSWPEHKYKLGGRKCGYKFENVEDVW